MRQEKIVLANAFAVTVAVVWSVCSLLVAVFPTFALTVTIWLMHGMALSPWNLTWGNFLLGGLTSIVAAWLSAYLFGWCWETFSGKRSVLYRQEGMREA